MLAGGVDCSAQPALPAQRKLLRHMGFELRTIAQLAVAQAHGWLTSLLWALGWVHSNAQASIC